MCLVIIVPMFKLLL